jgi:NADH-quinone oxidoreductase subunit L
MLLPLCVLALLSVGTGFIPFSDYVSIGRSLPPEGIDWRVAVPGTLVAILGLGASAWMYARPALALAGPAGAPTGAGLPLGGRGFAYTAVKNKFYVDELYILITKNVIFERVAAPIAWFDRNVVDGAVNLCGAGMRGLSSLLALLQTGQLQTYALWLVLGTIACCVLLAGLA